MDPFHLPHWQVEILARQMDALEAEERLGALDVEFAPWAKEESQRQGLIWSLINRAKHGLMPKPTPPQVLEYNPAKAAAWLRARGVQVVESDQNDHV